MPLSLLRRGPRVAPATGNENRALTSTAVPQSPGPLSAGRPTSRPDRRPAETRHAPPVKRERTRGSLVVDLEEETNTGLNGLPRLSVSFQGKGNGTPMATTNLSELHSNRAATDDNVRLVSAKMLQSPLLPPPLDPAGLFCRRPKVTPKDLQAKSLAAGRRALLVHFALLSRYRCSVVDLTVLDVLLSHGADVNVHDELGQGLLHEVARLWDASVAK